MANTRGIFTLTYIREEKIPLDRWVNLNDVWSSPTAPNTGYFGGSLPGPRSTIDKITYSNDTVALSPSALLSASRYYTAGTGSATAGYFGGGINPSVPGVYSTTDKLTYSTDTVAAVPGAPLSVARFKLSATGSSVAGYFGGGQVPGAPSLIYSTMDKLTYSSDTASALPGAPLSATRYWLSATGSLTAGYFGGGANPGLPNYSTMDKLTYSLDTVAAVPGAKLSVARFGLSATGSSTAGYFAGGTPGPRSTTDKLVYASDTTAEVPAAAVSNPRYGMGATSSSTAGYFAGGGVTAISTIDKLSYSSDTTVASPSVLSVTRLGSAGVSARANALPLINLNFATKFTDSTLSPNTGYFGGGTPGTGSVSTMDKVTYSSDTTAAVPGARLSAARYRVSATGSSIAGYFGGGRIPSGSAYSTMDKVTYSTDTRTTVPGAALSIARCYLAATGNFTAG